MPGVRRLKELPRALQNIPQHQFVLAYWEEWMGRTGRSYCGCQSVPRQVTFERRLLRIWCDAEYLMMRILRFNPCAKGKEATTLRVWRAFTHDYNRILTQFATFPSPSLRPRPVQPERTCPYATWPPSWRRCVLCLCRWFCSGCGWSWSNQTSGRFDIFRARRILTLDWGTFSTYILAILFHGTTNGSTGTAVWWLFEGHWMYVEKEVLIGDSGSATIFFCADAHHLLIRPQSSESRV